MGPNGGWLAAALALLVALAAPAHGEDPIVTLDDAQARALATHEAIRAAAAEQERARVAPWRAWSVLGPNVSDAASYTRVKEQIAFPIPAGTAFNPVVIAQDVLRNVLSVSQPLYTHQFWGLRDIGRAEVRRSDEAYRAARADVLLAVAAAYYDLLRARSLEDVAEQTQRLADTEISHARDRVRTGMAVEADTLRAQAERARADERVAESTALVANSTDLLRRLAGLEGPFRVEEPPPQTVDVSTAEPFVATALAKNPDLLAREAAVAAAEGEERRRRALLYPTVGVGFTYQNLNHETFVDLNDFWTLALQAHVPIFEEGGTHILDIAEQRALVNELAAQTAGFRRDLEVDVRRAWTTVHTLAVQREAAEKTVALDSETYRMLSARYEDGYATDLDVLTALTNLDGSRANLTSLRYAGAVALVQLERVAGTL